MPPAIPQVAADAPALARSFAQDARLVGTVSVAHFARHLFPLALPSPFPLLREALGATCDRLLFAAAAAVMLVTIATVIQVRRRAVLAGRA